MNAIGSSILILLMLVVTFGSKRVAVLGMIASVMYLTQGQSINLGGLNLTAIRFVEIAGFFRVIRRSEFSFARLNTIDKALILFYSYSTVVFLMRSSDGHVYQIGLMVDALLSYFIFRGLIGNIDEFKWFLSAFIILLVPYVLIVFVERQTANNPFSIIGGITGGAKFFRNGIPRCYGSFRHPTLFGTLGASFLPIYIGLMFDKMYRKCAFFGIGLCLAIVFLSNSGGPMSTAFVGLVGWLTWCMRRKMFLFRRSIVAFIVLMSFVMNSPIWYLPAKISSITGGDGYHRSFLIEQAVHDIGRWWLAGMSIKDTSGWFPYVLQMTGGADITNQFINVGLTAGLMSVILFIILLVKAFKNLGRAMLRIRVNMDLPRETEFFLWGLGVSLTAHIANWIGVVYFDQIYVVWFMQLAAISTLTNDVRRSDIRI